MRNKVLSYFEYRLSRNRFCIFKTIYLNFRVLPFKQAMYLPIYCYGHLCFRNLLGKIVINSSKIEKGMIKIGLNMAGYTSLSPVWMNLESNSRIICNGKLNISQGCSLTMGKNAIMEFGPNVNLGDNVKIICFKHIRIGEMTGVTWDCQIMDYNSHFVEDTNTGMISNIKKEVWIGEYCWICNRTTIMPGTKLPNRIIVSSNSLLNKDYEKLGIVPYSIIGGIPAKLIKCGSRRIYNSENEKRLLLYFEANSSSSVHNTLVEVEK